MKWDVIVVGAGIEGSAAAYTLAKRGLKTLQLEQFQLPHSRGSSHGQSRITRMAYAEDFYTRMMVDAFKLWTQLETESKQQLYVKTGLLAIDVVGSSALDDVEKAIRSTGETCERLTGKTLAARFPTMTFDDSLAAVFDPTGGILCADRCLRAYQTQFVDKYNGTLHDGEAVLNITHVAQDEVHVRTSKDVYRTRSIVLAAGPWTKGLADQLGLKLPLQPQRVKVWYWKQMTSKAFGDVGSPVFIKLEREHEVYGFPVFEYPGFVKVAYHGGPHCEADRRDAAADDPFYVNFVAQFVRKHLNDVESTPSVTETCIYTLTPDKNFILDTHPQMNNVVIAAGFSGHGFKLAPVVGQIVADLVTGKASTSPYDLSPFKISRFTDGRRLQTSRL